MIARGNAPGSRSTNIPSPERARQAWLPASPEPSCETFQAALDYIARCDQLSVAELRQPNLPADEGSENKPETEGRRPEMQEGEPCRKCSTPVIKRTGKWKPGRDSYYEFHLICPNCQTTHQVESAKRFVEQPLSFL